MLILVALALLIFLPHPWNVFAGAVCALLWLGELYLWDRTVRGRRKAVGTQTLIGKIAEVRVACRPRGQVFLDGELWAAECSDGADAGTRVRVLRVKGLMLEVEPAS
jgi:membrane protein implicated in regulation of membrane protease activity